MSLSSKTTGDEHIEIVIEKLKSHYLVKTDQELAKALGLGRSTVATWRNRQRVPEKYEKLANGEYTRKFYGETPWEFWSELEKAGMELACLRVMRDFGELLHDYSAFLRHSASIPTALADYHGKACDDIACEIAEHQMTAQGELGVRACLQRMVYEEFFKA